MIRLADLIPEGELRHTGPGIMKFSNAQRTALQKLEYQLAHYQSMMHWNVIDYVDYKDGPDETIAIKIEGPETQIYIEPWVKNDATIRVFDKHGRVGSKVVNMSDVKGILRAIKIMTMRS